MYSIGRRMCFTTSGYIGSVPHESQIGDMICIFEGGKVPFVVRNKSGGGQQLVGECYIHGIMDGELMEKALIKHVRAIFNFH
ncbi:hypothetical protein BDZ45DRAFT_579097 [Acephala macrosclerotiorum]|nr:hypothetical protein BDZ45DRAFT_579097 [Acephala macrosclerotiorum]